MCWNYYAACASVMKYPDGHWSASRRKTHADNMRTTNMKNFWLLTLLPLAACTPRIALEAPKDPITINLNVKIDHEIRLKVEKDVDKLTEDSKLF